MRTNHGIRKLLETGSAVSAELWMERTVLEEVSRVRPAVGASVTTEQGVRATMGHLAAQLPVGVHAVITTSLATLGLSFAG
jgi:hypothetical protein